MYQNLIKPAFADLKTFVLDTLFPTRCLRCDREGKFICAGCLSVLKRLEHQHCIICQKPSIGGFTHPGCQTPYGADGLISILNYHDDDVANIIIKGKYNFLPGVFEELGNMLAEKIKNQYPNILISNISLVPLPLHKRRLRWRGFNQAEILCRTIGAELNIRSTSVLVRCKATKTQKDLKRDQRIKNVANAFSLSPTPLLFKEGWPPQADGVVGDIPTIKNQNLILVDDVTTTGSTLLEAAKVLKRKGAAKVWCLTVARD